MKRLLLLTLLLSSRIWADTHVPAGPVFGVWTLAGSPYLIEGNVLVETAATLTIAPGVVVILDPGCRFRIEGRLLAEGTVNDSIYFIAADTALGSEGLHFLNTNISPLDSSKLAYCEISYGVAAPPQDFYMHGGGIYANNSSRLLIEHCHIHHCRTMDAIGLAGANGSGGYPVGNPGSPGAEGRAGGGGAIYIENCGPNITYCTIEYNHTGSGRGGNGGHGASVSNSGASNLSGGDGGAGGPGYGGYGSAIYLKNSSANLRNNVIRNNYSGAGSGGRGGNGGNALADSNAYGGIGGIGGEGFGGEGGAIYVENSTTQLDNNLFYENATGNGVGGRGGNGGTATVSPPYYWTAYHGAGGSGGNGQGGNGYAMSVLNSPLLGLRMATFTAHSSISQGQGGLGGFSGGGLPAASGQGFIGTAIIQGTTLLIVNAIVWDNADSFIDSSVTVSWSCLQGGHVGIGNIASDPLFVNPLAHHYFLAQIAAGQPQNSPCVDAGNPASFMIPGSTRSDSIQDFGRMDMGYHYPLNLNLIQVEITMEPANPPILIPAVGGSFDFFISVANLGVHAMPLNVWIMQRNPLGLWQGPMMGPVEFILPSNRLISRWRTQTVPGSAQAGVYDYKGYVGLYPEFPWDSTGFIYEKLLTGAGSFISDWVCTGDPFPGELGGTRSIASTEYSEEYIVPSIFPNPFNETTTISFQLSANSHVRLKVYNTTGEMVAALVDGWRVAGKHEVPFNGSELASGLYFVQMNAKGISVIRKMILMR